MIFRDGIMQALPFIIAAMIPALTFHEWGHAAMAKAFGDDTAERQGRLSLNPFVHLDPMGVIFFLMAGFGWAKPVPVDLRQLRGGRWGEFWVASAGPLMNIVLAVVFAILIRLGAENWFGLANTELASGVLTYSLFVNLALCFFNLIPVGPLDGRAVFARFLPFRSAMAFEDWNVRYGGIALLGIIIADSFLGFGILRVLVWAPASFIGSLLAGS